MFTLRCVDDINSIKLLFRIFVGATSQDTCLEGKEEHYVAPLPMAPFEGSVLTR